ncbi:glycoside hydrolase family 16 protein [Novosphingobium ginsenosidimutans]|uniref:Glycoside hydrolase family 16 protein n=1 Tax=Novosphingobium ginsenosidimutans TaxID=1176536 RepID=A0A5B8S0G5_9SPHN|nr:glycoside hydrolase family 16 protein [Novosphingobium ginsenosidimutans]QEA15011.1 glycoside hydrolase family 16 protein [Novosphingobium ginsenosidimutans]
MKRAAVLALALLAAPAAAADNWTMVWSDEFDGDKIDRSKWGFDVDCWGGGNDEHQCYTKSPRNATIEDGKLVITARYERVTGPALPEHLRRTSATPEAEATRDISSARLSTRGKASWRYGKVEVRAKLPQGQGTWPAIWMLPEKDRYGTWAASGEIDILEAVNLGVPCAKCPGGRENTILGTLHFGGKWPNNKHKGEEVPFPEVLDGGFHTYAIEWGPERITWQVDGKTYAVRTADEWSTTGSKVRGAPFDQPFHLILNLAIGGKLAETRGLGGVRLDSYPKRMEIDWVRVWQVPEAKGISAETGSAQGGK